MSAPSGVRAAAESVELGGADHDLFALGRRGPHDEMAVVLSDELLRARAALTASGVGTGKAIVDAAQQVLPGISAAVAPITAATEVIPGSAATMAGVNLSARPAAELLAEGGTYTGATAIVQTSGQLSPLHIMAVQPVSRQWLRMTGRDDVLFAECWAACYRLLERELARAYHDDTRIAAVTTALSATTVHAELATMHREVSAAEVRVMSSPIGATKLAALNAATFSADWRQVAGVPHLVSPGISEAEGAGTNETAVFIGSPRAAVLATWGAYTITDPYTLKKRGLVELVTGLFVRPLIVRPHLVRRIDQVATT